MKKILYLLLSLTMILSGYSQSDTLTVMYYNLLNFPTGEAERVDDLEDINQYILPDVLLVNELVNFTGAQMILNQTLNIGGISNYSMANYINCEEYTDNLLFYKHDKLALSSQSVIETDLRDINEYVLYYLSDDIASTEDTIFFYFFVTHLKAGNQTANEQQRLAEVLEFRQYVDAIPNAENIFFGGDFNLYSSSEPAYNALVNQGLYPLNDPVQPPGNWHDNYNYRHIHSQSTRTAQFGGGATGGLDDRFDFILFSDDVLSGANKVNYIDNSYEAFGNDGNHFNISLIETPLNPNIPTYVTEALYYMSDHLPVLIDIEVEANVNTSEANLVITEIMYNPPESGTDSLEFIEIWNRGNTTENIGGYQIQNAVSITFPVVDLAPGDFIIAATNPSAMMNTFGVESFQWSGGLSNGGEEIILTNALGVTLDVVDYDDSNPWPEEADGDGNSLALCDPELDNNNGANWIASQHFVMNNGAGNPIYASPGDYECAQSPMANFEADQTEVIVGSSIHFTDLSQNEPDTWQWYFEGGTPENSFLQNPVVSYSSLGEFDVQLMVSNEAGSDILLMENYINVIESQDPELIITEIMQNPYAVSDGNGEWFEVYNPTSSAINMNGYIIKDNDGDSEAIIGDLIVEAQGFAVLGRNANTAQNGNYQCDYQYSELFYLANAEDEVIICLPDGVTELDRVEYDDNWSLLSGKSIVFTGSFNDNNNDPAYWIAATLREDTFVGSAGDLGSPGTNGYDQNLVVGNRFLDIKVFLEGPYTNGTMNTELQSLDDFPLLQPYGTTPWNYFGVEEIAEVPNSEVVDWVLVELRDATSSVLANEGSIKERKALLLLHDGSVVDLNGSSLPEFSISIDHGLFISVLHRNHIGILSMNALNPNGETYSYDFSNGELKVLGGLSGHKILEAGIYGMASGDVDGSGLVDINDIQPDWENNAGKSGYKPSDINLDREINNIDKDDFWYPNLNFESQIPE